MNLLNNFHMTTQGLYSQPGVFSAPIQATPVTIGSCSLLRVSASERLRVANEKLYAANLKIQALTLELAHHKRIRFGAKTEAMSSIQRELFEQNWQEDCAALEQELENTSEQLSHADASSKPKKKRKANAKRQPLPDHLPRVEHRHEPDSCQCGQCGSDLIKVREDVSEKLDVVPAQFTVHRHITPQYACKSCQSIVAKPVEPAIIDGGIASAGLLSWVMISKYADHLPLYRIQQIAERQGVTLASSTLAEWVGKTGVQLQPLADALTEKLKSSSVIHADETPVNMLDPGAGKTKKAYLWAWRSNDLALKPLAPIVVFRFARTRASTVPQDFLADWHGNLLVDDYAGYKPLFNRENSTIEELACWAHARRKFTDLALANKSPLALEALHRIGQLYVLEDESKKMDAISRARQREKAAQQLKDLHKWLLKNRGKVAHGSALAKAMDYLLKRWSAFARYAENIEFPIDNNPVENAIRPIALGKKNWLFVGSVRAGERAAAIQSLIATAKLNGLDPAAWMTDVLTKLPTWPNSRIHELLPLKQNARVL